MECPVDQSVLQMTERQGVEIDYCPQCRGVWLDRGELDKIIDRSAEVESSPSRPVESRRPEQTSRYDDQHSYDSRGYKKKKKDSFLGDLFDF